MPNTIAQDEDLADRLRDALEGLQGISEKRMMGGICFLLDGNMLGGVNRNKTTGAGHYMFRIGKEHEADGAARPEAEPVVMGGRRMGGMFYVAEDACSDAVLKDWVELSLRFVGSLPAKG